MIITNAPNQVIPDAIAGVDAGEEPQILFVDLRAAVDEGEDTGVQRIVGDRQGQAAIGTDDGVAGPGSDR